LSIHASITAVTKERQAWDSGGIAIGQQMQRYEQTRGVFESRVQLGALLAWDSDSGHHDTSHGSDRTK